MIFHFLNHVNFVFYFLFIKELLSDESKSSSSSVGKGTLYAVTAATWRGRVLISRDLTSLYRHKSHAHKSAPPITVAEFNSHGELVETISLTIQDTIIPGVAKLILTCHEHVAICSDNGMVIFVKALSVTHRSVNDKSIEERNLSIPIGSANRDDEKKSNHVDMNMANKIRMNSVSPRYTALNGDNDMTVDQYKSIESRKQLIHQISTERLASTSNLKKGIHPQNNKYNVLNGEKDCQRWSKPSLLHIVTSQPNINDISSRQRFIRRSATSSTVSNLNNSGSDAPTKKQENRTSPLSYTYTKVIAGCSLTVPGTGIDIFFLADHEGGITVVYLSEGNIVNSSYNKPFFSYDGTVLKEGEISHNGIEENHPKSESKNTATSVNAGTSLKRCMILAISAIGSTLYVGLSIGKVAIINLKSVLLMTGGGADCLWKYVTGIEEVLVDPMSTATDTEQAGRRYDMGTARGRHRGNGTLLSTMTVVAPMTYLKLSSPNLVNMDSRDRDDRNGAVSGVSESDLLLIGGGDLHPVVKVIRVVSMLKEALIDVNTADLDYDGDEKHYKRGSTSKYRCKNKVEEDLDFRLVATLKGHSLGIQQVLSDAVGRYIFSASQRDMR